MSGRKSFYGPFLTPERLILLLIILLGLVLGALLWVRPGGLRDHCFPKRWGVVQAGYIYRSGQMPPFLLKKLLRRHQIRRIVDLQFLEPTNTWQLAEQKIAGELGIQYTNHPLYGSGIGEVWHYARAIGLMYRAAKEQQPVLVHCAAGSQRTGGVVAAYRLLIEKQSPATVYAELLSYGWVPQKDQLLLDFLNERMAELAARLLEMEVIDAIPDPLPVIGP